MQQLVEARERMHPDDHGSFVAERTARLAMRELPGQRARRPCGPPLS